MNQEEKDRLFEVLFYLYFNNKDSKILASALFWQTITAICTLYGINSRAIVQSARILTANENCPDEKETYYLLNKLGLTVRPIKAISGIYWQKQKQYAEEFTINPPVVKRHLLDVVYKKSIRDFIFAIYDIGGVLGNISKEDLEKL